jgi:hypothetical protein
LHNLFVLVPPTPSGAGAILCIERGRSQQNATEYLKCSQG